MESKIRKAHIVYFTGTGGTALAAKTLKEELDEIGVATKADEIFREDFIQNDNQDILIIMFPVYAADAPLPIGKWIKKLPAVTCGKACVVAVSGGGEISPNTACRRRTVKRLRKKGYEVFGEYMLCMPSNFIEKTETNTAVRLLEILPKKCMIIAENIASEKEVFKKTKFIDHVLLPLFSMEKLGSKIFGKTLKTNDTCNACGLCARKCPRDNIKMNEGKPQFGWECVICMRCIYACPQSSIKIGMPILKKMVLNDSYDINEMQKLAQNAPTDESENKVEGYLWQGVKEYLENPDFV